MLNYRFLWLFALVMACVGLAGAFAGGQDAAAQDPEEFVDLSVEVTVLDATSPASSKVYLSVSNLGNRAAYDVYIRAQVKALVDIPPTVGTYNASRNQRPPNDIFEWHIPELPGYAEYTVRFRGTLGGANPIDTILDHHYATVTSSSYEPPDRMHNNRDEIWEIWWIRKAGPAEPDYSVRVSAENTSASSADFTVTAVRPARDDGESIFKDGCINVGLTAGLTAGTPTFTKLGTGDTAPVAATGRSFDTSTTRECGGSGDATGVFKLPEYHEDLESIMTLPVTVASGATLSEQCLTAKIFAAPSTGTGRFYDDLADNEAKVCLGEPPDETVIFTSGASDLFTWYDCSEITGHPCGASVSLELVALGGTAALDAGLSHSALDPDNVVVLIGDPAGRAESSDSNSDGLVWSTGLEDTRTGHTHEGDRPGIILGDNPMHLDIETTDDNDQWGVPDATYPTEQVGDLKVEVTGPGKVSSWYISSNAATSFYGSGTGESIYDSIWYLGYRYDIWLEFNRLGTYTVKQTIKAKYDDDTTDTTDPTEYTDSGTYTFHVGPLAELGVVNGGGRWDVSAERSAITIAALNNGPDYATDAEVTVNLSLPDGVTVAEHIASDGTYTNGTWDLGALKTTNYRRGVGEPGAATLIFILDGDDADSATATATIANVADYTVCISSSGQTLAHTSQTDCDGDAATTNVWYGEVCVNTADNEIDSTITVEATCNGTTDRAWKEDVCASSDGSIRTGRTEAECGGWFQGTVYDHRDGNNSATITAQAGTGGGGDDAPSPSAAKSGAPSVTVQWEPVATVNRVAVTHYQVERSASDWEIVADDVEGTVTIDEEGNTRLSWIDTTVQPGKTYRYRVRAVNGNGVAGPPSAPIDTSVPSGGTRTVTVIERVYLRPEGPKGLAATAQGETEVVLDWDPLNSLYDEPVDYYEVEASENGKYWQTLAPSLTETAYTHRGLEAGETHYYRVYAHSEEGRSLASAVTCGSAGDALGKPCILDVDVDSAAVTLSWVNAQGADGHHAILMNASDYSFHGDTTELPAETTSHTFRDVPAGQYLALVVAYSGSLEGYDYRYEWELITVE